MPSHSHNVTSYGQYGGAGNRNIIGGDGAGQLTTPTSNTGGSGSHNHNAGHNLSSAISGSPSIGTLSGSISSASASINVKFQDFIIAQKD
jgi:hypothetical protein